MNLLTPQDVLDIRHSKKPRIWLALKYNRSIDTISRIQRREKWKHIDDAGNVKRRMPTQAKLTEEIILTVVFPRLAAGEELAPIARDVNVAVSTICEIACRRRWKHLPRPAELANRHGYDGPEETR